MFRRDCCPDKPAPKPAAHPGSSRPAMGGGKPAPAKSAADQAMDLARRAVRAVRKIGK